MTRKDLHLLEGLGPEAEALGMKVMGSQDKSTLLVGLTHFLNSNNPPLKSVALCPGLEEGVGGLAQGLKEHGFEVFMPHMGMDYTQVIQRVGQVDAGITPVYLFVRETLTILLENDTPYIREISLLPPVHIALIEKSQVVKTLEDAPMVLQRGGGRGMGYTFITGPSKTADIELNLVRGVHGPRDLILWFLGEPGP